MNTATYRAVLRTPGALRVFIPALIGRWSAAMVTLSLIFAVQGSTGSFAIAGLVTGAFGIANVVAAPPRARLVDRWGQRRSLTLFAVIHALGLCSVAALTAVGEPVVWLVIAAAVVTGAFMPPLGAAMRVLWARIAATNDLRVRAYSLDAVAEEVLFTTGPLLAAAVIAIGSPAAGLGLTAFVALVGTIGMTSSAVSRSVTAAQHAPAVHLRPLRQPGFLPVLVALLSAGFVLGVMEVAAPAFATELGSVELAGVLLACFAAGSGVGGILYGRRTFRSSLAVRLVVLGSIMAALSGALGLAPNVVVLGIGLAAVGAFLAPSLVTGYLLADELTDPSVQTEASSWINTAVNTGGAIAAAGAGAVVDGMSTSAAFALGAVAALVCLAIAAPSLVRRRQPRGWHRACRVTFWPSVRWSLATGGCCCPQERPPHVAAHNHHHGSKRWNWRGRRALPRGCCQAPTRHRCSRRTLAAENCGDCG